MVEYIHYGSANFDPCCFMQVANQSFITKPRGGLWASRVDAKRGWRDWCEGEEFGLDCLNINFRF